jgi:alpha-D-ribose 1-methylphosphonate 5-triphosphate synthase subunit PhnH
MARPGQVGSVSTPFGDGRHAAGLAVLESLLDHEVTFAVVPPESSIIDTLLRRSGSRLADLAEADYVLAEGVGVLTALRSAKSGTFESPERSGTVVAIVDDISATMSSGLCLTLSGPGIRDLTDVWLDGITSEQVSVLTERNAEAPLGIDLVLAAASGRVMCIPRYTRVEEFGV